MNIKNKLNNENIKNNDNIQKSNLLFNNNKNKKQKDFYNKFKYSLKNQKQPNNNMLNKKSSSDKYFNKQENSNLKKNKNINNSKKKEIKKSESQKTISNRNIKNNKEKKEYENINKLIFPLKSNEDKKQEDKNIINIQLIMNNDIKYYKPKNIKSSRNLYISNKELFVSPNNKKKNIKENSLKNININTLKYGTIKYSNIINEEKSNDLNLKYFNEINDIKGYKNESGNYISNMNSLIKTNTKKELFDVKNNINIIKKEKEIEYKKPEKRGSVISEIGLTFFNFDDSNSSSDCSMSYNIHKENNNKSQKNLLIPKVEVKAEANLDILFSKYKKSFNLNNNNNNKTLSPDLFFNKNKYNLKYLNKPKLDKSSSSKKNHKNHICFIMNDDIITDNKNSTIISLGSKSKKNNKINLRKFQTNDTEINKIQDILSHGDKTFSELAYDKGVSDVVDKIPSPNSHRGSKDVVPISIQNPNENYGPLKSLFSIGLDKKDESSYSSSPCCSRSNSNKVVKIITGPKIKKNKYRNIIKNNDLIEDDKKLINNNIDEIDENNFDNKDNEDNERNKIDKDENNINIYPDQIWSEQDIELSSKLKNDLNNENFNKFADFFNKLEEGIQNKKNNNKYLNIDIGKTNEFEEDYNLISQMTSEFEKLEENYKKECDKINDKLFKMSRLTNFILQQSFPNNHSLRNTISSFSQRLERMDNQYNKEVKNYKKIIENLIEQLQNLSEDSENAIDKKLLQEIKEIEFSQHQIFNIFLENKNYTNDDKNSENIDKKELIEELERFKHEEKEYRFSIPQKYSLDTNKIKLIKNGIIKGLFVKVYENKVIDIINKHGTTKRIFPDGFQINIYNNKDIKLRYVNKDEFCFYHVNQTEEFRFPSKGIIVYKFKNGQFEKHYSNYEFNIKFSDGSYRIIRKEKELFQYPDGILEFKDKKGNKSYMDSINDIEEGLSKSIKLKYKKNRSHPI